MFWSALSIVFYLPISHHLCTLFYFIMFVLPLLPLSAKTQQSSMKKLPLGKQSIKEILQDNMVYVDKTGLILELINENKDGRDRDIYEVVRPSGFGKTLLLDTIRLIFEGEEELFKNTEISRSKYDWKKYPVLYYDFSEIASDIQTCKDFEKRLDNEQKKLAKKYNVTPEYTCRRWNEPYNNETHLVILIDNYDYKNEVLQECNWIFLRFFEKLQEADNIRLLVATAVQPIDVTPDWNMMGGLSEISNRKYATLLGFTEQECLKYFDEHISVVAKQKMVPKESIVNEVRAICNEYRFHSNDEYHDNSLNSEVVSVARPHSILSYLQRNIFNDSWKISLGKSKLPIKMITDDPSAAVHCLLKSFCRSPSLRATSSLSILLYREGYLTVKGHNFNVRARRDDLYEMDFINPAVRRAYINILLRQFAGTSLKEVTKQTIDIVTNLQDFDCRKFILKIRRVLRSIGKKPSYGVNNVVFQTVLLGLLSNNAIESIRIPKVKKGFRSDDVLFVFPNVVYVFVLRLRNEKNDEELIETNIMEYKKLYNNKYGCEKSVIMKIYFAPKLGNIYGWEAKIYRGNEKIDEMQSTYMNKKEEKLD